MSQKPRQSTNMSYVDLDRILMSTNANLIPNSSHKSNVQRTLEAYNKYIDYANYPGNNSHKLMNAKNVKRRYTLHLPEKKVSGTKKPPKAPTNRIVASRAIGNIYSKQNRVLSVLDRISDRSFSRNDILERKSSAKNMGNHWMKTNYKNPPLTATTSSQQMAQMEAENTKILKNRALEYGNYWSRVNLGRSRSNSLELLKAPQKASQNLAPKARPSNAMIRYVSEQMNRESEILDRIRDLSTSNNNFSMDEIIKEENQFDDGGNSRRKSVDTIFTADVLANEANKASKRLSASEQTLAPEKRKDDAPPKENTEDSDTPAPAPDDASDANKDTTTHPKKLDKNLETQNIMWANVLRPISEERDQHPTETNKDTAHSKELNRNSETQNIMWPNVLRPIFEKNDLHPTKTDNGAISPKNLDNKVEEESLDQQAQQKESTSSNVHDSESAIKEKPKKDHTVSSTISNLIHKLKIDDNSKERPSTDSVKRSEPQHKLSASKSENIHKKVEESEEDSKLDQVKSEILPRNNEEFQDSAFVSESVVMAEDIKEEPRSEEVKPEAALPELPAYVYAGPSNVGQKMKEDSIVNATELDSIHEILKDAIDAEAEAMPRRSSFKLEKINLVDNGNRTSEKDDDDYLLHGLKHLNQSKTSNIHPAEKKYEKRNNNAFELQEESVLYDENDFKVLNQVLPKTSVHKFKEIYSDIDAENKLRMSKSDLKNLIEQYNENAVPPRDVAEEAEIEKDFDKILDDIEKETNTESESKPKSNVDKILDDTQKEPNAEKPKSNVDKILEDLQKEANAESEIMPKSYVDKIQDDTQKETNAEKPISNVDKILDDTQKETNAEKPNSNVDKILDDTQKITNAESEIKPKSYVDKIQDDTQKETNAEKPISNVDKILEDLQKEANAESEFKPKSYVDKILNDTQKETNAESESKPKSIDIKKETNAESVIKSNISVSDINHIFEPTNNLDVINNEIDRDAPAHNTSILDRISRMEFEENTVPYKESIDKLYHIRDQLHEQLNDANEDSFLSTPLSRRSDSHADDDKENNFDQILKATPISKQHPSDEKLKLIQESREILDELSNQVNNDSAVMSSFSKDILDDLEKIEILDKYVKQEKSDVWDSRRFY